MSNNGNGNGQPIPFKRQLPIIGQPFTMKAWFLTVAITCNCEGKEPVLLVGNGLGKCGECGRQFQLQGIKASPNGDVQFTIGIVADAPPPMPEGVPV